jgi:SAM-dependent methyltransferase
MELITEIKERLICPSHKESLTLHPGVFSIRGVPWPDGLIACPRGCIFAIEDGVPRFVSRDNYAAQFGLQWRRYQRTQLDSYTGQPISRQRLERCLGSPLDRLKGKLVLECGCGAGRFTELLIDNCELVVSMDLSDAVDANLKNCSDRKPYILCQADINNSPLPRRFFDIVVCLGVIQHSPSPEQMIASLAEHLKPGGMLVIDHYTLKSVLRRVSHVLSLAFPLRAIFKRLSPELGLKMSIALTGVCDPIRKRTCKWFWLDRVVGRAFPSRCYYNTFTSLDPKICYEWNELDTHDYFTDYYKHFRTREQIQATLATLGFHSITCIYAGNGVEARAVLSQRQ